MYIPVNYAAIQQDVGKRIDRVCKVAEEARTFKRLFCSPSLIHSTTVDDHRCTLPPGFHRWIHEKAFVACRDFRPPLIFLSSNIPLFTILLFAGPVPYHPSQLHQTLQQQQKQQEQHELGKVLALSLSLLFVIHLSIVYGFSERENPPTYTYTLIDGRRA